jgi:hypothetical protein
VVRQSLFDKVVSTTQDYLGPASERFVQRQIRTHLHKEPGELTASDIKKLTEWLKVAMALLTEDEDLVKDYTKSLLTLAKAKKNVIVNNHR